MAPQPDELHAVFVSHPCIIAAYLFGSVARGRPMPWSDVDIALLFSNDASEEEKQSAADEVAGVAERVFERVCVPIDLGNQGVIFQHNVLSNGRKLYINDIKQHTRFVQRTIMWYLDFLPTYRIFERAQAQYIRKQASVR